jgi:hypothetical protein
MKTLKHWLNENTPWYERRAQAIKTIQDKKTPKDKLADDELHDVLGDEIYRHMESVKKKFGEDHPTVVRYLRKINDFHKNLTAKDDGAK